LPLSGADAGQRAYKVARLQLQPQLENLSTVFRDGWHAIEGANHNGSAEWQWTKKQATLAFRNPKRDAIVYLDMDAASGVFKEPQQVRVSSGDAVIEEFPLEGGRQVLKKMSVTAAQL